jgi:hydrogenase nickel incorporation protein HypB
MCETCGCGEKTAVHEHEAEQKKIEIEERVLSKNEGLAEKNRDMFAATKVAVVNMVSSPGAGKTTLLERTIRELKDEMTIGVIEGDQQTDRDAQRIAATGVHVHQINTMDACHLDAHMIQHALGTFSLEELDLLFIENVGNLICPGAFDLGEDSRVVLLSTTEGEDKPLKYPGIFIGSQLAIINKVDLLEVLEIDLNQYLSFVKRVNPSLECLSVSAKTGEGMAGWYDWLRQKISEKSGRPGIRLS